MSVAIALGFLSLVCIVAIARNRVLSDRLKAYDQAWPGAEKLAFDRGVKWAQSQGLRPIEERERAAYILGVQHGIEACSQEMGVTLRREAVRKAGESAGKAWDAMQEPEPSMREAA